MLRCALLSQAPSFGVGAGDCTPPVRVAAEQERDLLRAFRARLFDVQTELEKMKSKTEDKAAVRGHGTCS